MSEFRADLHTHTTCSDGALTPFELIDECVKVGLSGLSITDHDTIAAYTDALFDYAKSRNVALLTGVEFSTEFQNHSVHVLGYNFDVDSQEINALTEQHRKRRLKRAHHIVENLKREGIDLNIDELPDAASVGRVHIAQQMVKKGIVKDLREAFRLYLGKEGHFEPVGLEETLEVIHKANGRAVIAHPHLLRSNRLFRLLLKCPFDGVEGHYARFVKRQEKPFVQAAKERGLLVTGGSDFHGPFKPHSPLGCSWVDQPTFNQLLSRDA